MSNIIADITAKNLSPKIIKISRKINAQLYNIIFINDSSNNNKNIFKKLRLIKNSMIIEYKILIYILLTKLTIIQNLEYIK
jgi:hypothetical protein